MQNDIILTGLPRSGTTLACLLLSKLPDFLALNEPMRTATYRTYPKALAGVPDFYRDTRHSVLTRKKAVARVVDGKMTDNHFSNEKGQRKTLVRKQEIDIEKDLSPNFKLACKHNALYTILLPDLVKQYPVFAFVRNPLAVLASWNTLSIPASRGVVRAAEWLYPSLTEELARIPDLTGKQLHILNWYCKSYRDLLPTAAVIRYEDIVMTDGAALSPIDPSAATALDENLASRNRNKVYDPNTVGKVGRSLLADTENACWHFYDPAEVEKLLG